MPVPADLAITFAAKKGTFRMRTTSYAGDYAIQYLSVGGVRPPLVRGPIPAGGQIFYYYNNQVGRISEAEAANVLTQLQSMSVAKHGDIKNDPRWQRLYHHAARQVVFRNAAGVEGAQGGAINSYPCHYCGLILPTELIQVDHRQPQGAAMAGAFVLKCLHSMGAGLTRADATGAKNQQAAAIAAANAPLAVAALVPVPVKARAYGAVWAMRDGAVQPVSDRYTLTPKGTTLLTIGLMHYGTTLGGFMRICQNNILNLVPSCATCNGATGKHDMVHAY